MISMKTIDPKGNPWNKNLVEFKPNEGEINTDEGQYRYNEKMIIL